MQTISARVRIDSRPVRTLTAAIVRALALAASSLAVSAIAAAVVRAQSAPGASQPAAHSLHLVMVDLSGMPASLASGALGEIRTLLGPLGLEVSGETSAPRERRAGDGAWVVLLPFDRSRGANQTTSGVARNEYDGAPTVWAFPPKVARTLGVSLDGFGRWTNRDRREFHRALAVVIVHELAHALAGAAHRPRGLMRAGLERRELLDPALGLDPDLHQAFREGAARLAATPPLTTVRAASPSR